jgi:hypothetical protein
MRENIVTMGAGMFIGLMFIGIITGSLLLIGIAMFFATASAVIAK